MTRYGLALMSPQTRRAKWVGEFPSDRAFELAEHIAFDLAIEIESQWSGWSIEVRSAQGQKLFAVPVPGGDCTSGPERLLVCDAG